jgi:hypothetical protein
MYKEKFITVRSVFYISAVRKVKPSKQYIVDRDLESKMNLKYFVMKVKNKDYTTGEIPTRL